MKKVIFVPLWMFILCLNVAYTAPNPQHQAINFVQDYLNKKTSFSTMMDSVDVVVNQRLMQRDYPGVKSIYEEIKDLAVKSNDEILLVKFTLLLGNFYKITGDFAQSNSILKHAIGHHGLQDDDIQVYLHLASNHFQININEAKPYLDKASELITSSRDTATIMLYHVNMEQYARRKNNLVDAIHHNLESIKYMDAFPVQKVGAYISLIDYMLRVNNTQAAQQYLEEAKQSLQNDDERTKNLLTMSEAKVAYKLGNHSKAGELMRGAFEYFKETKLINQTAKSLYMLAGYAKAGGDEALYEFAIEQLQPVIKDMAENEYKISALICLAEYALQNGQSAMAEFYINSIQEVNIPENFLEKDSFLRLKARIYENSGKGQVAMDYYRQALVYQDSTNQLETNAILAYQESQYDRSQKEKEIGSLLLESSQKSKRLWILSLVLGGLALMFFLGLYFYRQLASKNRKISTQADELKKLVEEKNILIREIHHRVKNNLQVVSSLLNLQSNYITDPTALDAITEGKNRVGSMALIHQNLYQDAGLTDIDSQSYFDQLIDQLFESYNIDEESITLEKDIDPMLIDVDQMIPLGLIANELLSNALKHAFTQTSEGKVYVGLKDLGNELKLIIRDNGKGMDTENLNFENSFGFKMIQAFVNKLQAKLSVTSVNGTEISLQIPRKRLAA